MQNNDQNHQYHYPVSNRKSVFCQILPMLFRTIGINLRYKMRHSLFLSSDQYVQPLDVSI